MPTEEFDAGIQAPMCTIFAANSSFAITIQHIVHPLALLVIGYSGLAAMDKSLAGKIH
jgi:hypothetical protein